MKTFIFTLLLFSTSISFAQDHYYETFRYFLVDMTEDKIEAYNNRDVESICNSSKAWDGFDTFAYYTAFESLDKKVIKDGLIKDYGKKLYKKLLKIRNKRLAFRLHESCSKTKKRIGYWMWRIKRVFN